MIGFFVPVVRSVRDVEDELIVDYMVCVVG